MQKCAVDLDGWVKGSSNEIVEGGSLVGVQTFSSGASEVQSQTATASLTYVTTNGASFKPKCEWKLRRGRFRCVKPRKRNKVLPNLKWMFSTHENLTKINLGFIRKIKLLTSFLKLCDLWLYNPELILKGSYVVGASEVQSQIAMASLTYVTTNGACFTPKCEWKLRGGRFWCVKPRKRNKVLPNLWWMFLNQENLTKINFGFIRKIELLSSFLKLRDLY